MDSQCAGRLDLIVEKYRGARGAAIPLLADVQREVGCVSREALEYVGRRLSIPPAELFGVATFYAMFRFKPQGKYLVRLCRGTACHVQGSAGLLQRVERELGISDGETTPDLLFTLQCVACLGCCSLAPVMMVNGDVHGRLTPDAAVKVLNGLREAN
ncbi:MAG: NADH-quinone oxidoreductase subunit NuoE [Synergistaceae bacterium]|jgi:NADH-quinone oxidoreductase subunit E|nr:NADH-quinone oxidoreductase subunit NuoE [Synergistaceae bacterium]